jgi:hypothetical protein
MVVLMVAGRRSCRNGTGNQGMTETITTPSNLAGLSTLSMSNNLTGLAGGGRSLADSEVPSHDLRH